MKKATSTGTPPLSELVQLQCQRWITGVITNDSLTFELLEKAAHGEDTQQKALARWLLGASDLCTLSGMLWDRASHIIVNIEQPEHSRSLSWSEVVRRSSITPRGFPTDLSDAITLWKRDLQSDTNALVPWIYLVVRETRIRPEETCFELIRKTDGDIKVMVMILKATIAAFQFGLLAPHSKLWTDKVHWWAMIARSFGIHNRQEGERQLTHLLGYLGRELGLKDPEALGVSADALKADEIWDPHVLSIVPNFAGYLLGRALVLAQSGLGAEYLSGWYDGLATHVNPTHFVNDLERFLAFRKADASPTKRFQAWALYQHWYGKRISDDPRTIGQLIEKAVDTRGYDYWEAIAVPQNEKKPECTLVDAAAFWQSAMRKAT